MKKKNPKKVLNAFSLRSHHIPPLFIVQSVTEGIIWGHIKWLDHILTCFLVIVIFVNTLCKIVNKQKNIHRQRLI